MVVALAKKTDEARTTYIIPGDPIAMVKGGARNANYTSAKDNKMRYAVILENQHNDSPVYVGPLKLVIDFFFDIPIRSQDKGYDRKVGTYHTHAPCLSSLIKFIEGAAENILYGNDCMIAAIIANKYYDRQSRTEFYIQELLDGK